MSRKESPVIEPTQGSIEQTRRDLVVRFRTPLKFNTFYAHLLGGVMLCGGAGVIVTIMKSNRTVPEISIALLGYFPALIGAAMLEFNSERQQYLRSFSLIVLSVFVIVSLIIIKTENWWQLVWCLFATVLSILFWWVANGLNPRFIDIEPQTALGGDENRKLTASGEEGWKK